MNRYLDNIIRLISTLRPKTYNIIAKSVIGLGIVLVAESQIKILHIIAVSLYEKAFGYSELLRDFIYSEVDSWLGIFLIVIGLLYHYFVTVGQKIINLNEASKANVPELILEISNADKEPYSGDIISLRGSIVDTPTESDVPDYSAKAAKTPLNQILMTSQLLGGARKNEDYYRDRARFAKIWGGSELLRFTISNLSEQLASGVELTLEFPRGAGINAKNVKDELPKLPQESINATLNNLDYVTDADYKCTHDIQSEHTSTHNCFFWLIGNLQGGSAASSNSLIFLKLDQDTELKTNLFCDQFPRPISRTFIVKKAPIYTNLSITDLTASSSLFNHILHKCVMDGYILRALQKKVDEFYLRRSEHTP